MGKIFQKATARMTENETKRAAIDGLLFFVGRILMCWWGGCGGTIQHDGTSICWSCNHCNRVTR